MNFMKLLENSSELELLEFRYEFGVASFLIEVFDSEQVFRMRVKTNHVYSTFVDGVVFGSPVFLMSVLDLVDCLRIVNGVYVPNDVFPEFMREVQDGLNMVYGLRCSKYEKIIKFSGSFNISIVPVPGSEVEISLIEE